MPRPDERPGLPYLHIVEVLIVHQTTGHIALVRNMGEWWLPGGRVERGETFAEAAVREAAEETGLSVTVEGVVALTEVVEPARHAVFVTIRARSAGVGLTFPADDPKIDAARWADLETAEGLVGDYKPPLRELLGRTPLEQ